MNRNSRRVMMLSTHGYVSAEPEFGKPDTGGQVVYVLELSRVLARMGYHVDILTRRFDSQPAEECVSPRVRLLRFPCGGDEFIPKETLCDCIPEFVENVADWIKENSLEYLFINSHYWDAGLAGQALANRFDVPHVHTPHSMGAWKRDNMDGDPEELERKYNFRQRVRQEKVIYDECNVLIATTPTQRGILQAGDYDVPNEKTCVIPPGYDDSRFFPVSCASRHAIKQELDLEGRIILALGRIAKNKGYDLLLRAMPSVFERVPESRLLLAVGSSGPNEAEVRQVDALRQLAQELGIADRVIFRDYIPDDWLANYYRAADVFALSSRYEPFGMTAVEAMACGTPTVVTTEGGLWEQVTWGLEALYANPFDPEAFGHAIASALQYREVSDQLAKFGAQKARARFTWTGIAQQLLRLLDQSPQIRVHNALETAPPADEIEQSAGEESWNAEACL